MNQLALLLMASTLVNAMDAKAAATINETPMVQTATQGGVVRGKVLDKSSNTPLQYVNVRVMRQDSTLVKGAITDVDGNFHIDGLDKGQYILQLTSIGYKTISRNFSIDNVTSSRTFKLLYMSEDAKMLHEVTVTGMRSTMKLEVDRKSYDVSQLVTNAGSSASDALANIPSVSVDQDGNVSLRGSQSVEVWINGKASGLTSDNRAEILEQLPAESIDHVEIIDNPSAKFSAEGSAGIINIVLKQDRKPGYFGTAQVGAGTRGRVQSSLSLNYNSRLIDASVSVGYRHRSNEGEARSRQTFSNTNMYQNYDGTNNRSGNSLFTRANVTLHASSKDDISATGMLMHGLRKNEGVTPYHYGTIGASADAYLTTRLTTSRFMMNMIYGELSYRHKFGDKHFIDLTVDHNSWVSHAGNIYQDSTIYADDALLSQYQYQSRPMYVKNKRWEAKLDYENQLSQYFKLQAGYQGEFSRENTPQYSYIDKTSWSGVNAVENYLLYNRFKYNMDTHAFYATLSYNSGKWGAMLGLRGEYWKVNTKSDDIMASELSVDNHLSTSVGQPSLVHVESIFKKDYFQLFPSVFLSYQLTPSQQLQLSFTRRLRRPWGGQLNSFKDTRDATTVRYGNPTLTPEYSGSYQLNYLKTWDEHSVMLSLFYRPTNDVMQPVSYQNKQDGLIYSTTMNVTKSQSTGAEIVVKNRLFRILDLTTSAGAYTYHMDGFDFMLDGNNVKGDGQKRFSWNANVNAQVMLPYDINFQSTFKLNSRETMAQGYRKSSYQLDMGLKKNFLNKQLTVSINCRDVLNSRKWEMVTHTDTFDRYQLFRRGKRQVNFTVAWNFGNNRAGKNREKNDDNRQMQQEDDNMDNGGYSM